MNDYKGQELIAGVLELVDRLQPLHLSIVGGDPLERHRELQLVTSAFRPLPLEWAGYPNLMIVVSIDGLAPEHDVCRSPAMYERILKHMARQNVVIHCTVTGPMMKRPALDT